MSQAYPVVFGLGCLAGLGWLARRRGVSSADQADAFPAGVLALALGLAGARLGFAAVHAPYFLDHPFELLWVWEGGLSWVGGAAGGLAAVGVASRLRRDAAGRLADALALPALIIALAAWTGCFLEGCVYGMSVPAGPLSPPAPDLFGVVAPRWPTAAVGMTSSGLLLSAFILLEGRPLPTGSRAALALGGTALIALVLSLTRADPVLLVSRYRIDTVAAAAVLVASVLFGLILRPPPPRR